MNIYKPPSGRVEAIAVVVVVAVVVNIIIIIIHSVQSDDDGKHVLRGSVNRLDCGLSHQVVFVIIEKQQYL